MPDLVLGYVWTWWDSYFGWNTLRPRLDLRWQTVPAAIQGLAHAALLLGFVVGAPQVATSFIYVHPAVVEAMDAIIRICGEHDVVCGHPHVGTDNVAKLVEKGYRFLMAAPTTGYAALDQGMKLVERA